MAARGPKARLRRAPQGNGGGLGGFVELLIGAVHDGETAAHDRDNLLISCVRLRLRPSLRLPPFSSLLIIFLAALSLFTF